MSPNKRDLESNLLIPQESVSYVMFFLHKSRCLLSESPVPQFAKSLFVTSLRSSLRRSMETSTSQLCQMAEMLGICLDRKYRIGNKKSMMPAFGSKGNFFQLSFKSFHFTPRSNVLLQTTDKFAQLEEGECQILKNQLLTMEAQMELLFCEVETFNSAAVLPLFMLLSSFDGTVLRITSHF